MRTLSDKENRCIRIGRTYALLSTLLEYKHERLELTIGLRDAGWDSRMTRKIVQALALAITVPILALGGWLSRILVDRRLLRVCAQLDLDGDKAHLPVEKTLDALWNAHGPSKERLHGCSLDDRVDCLCLWLDVLYGEGTASRLHVRARVRELLCAEGQTIRETADIGVRVCFRDPLAVMIHELSAVLPAYNSVTQ